MRELAHDLSDEEHSEVMAKLDANGDGTVRLGKELHVPRAAAPCATGCSPMCHRLQPYIPEAATLCTSSCNPMYQVSFGEFCAWWDVGLSMERLLDPSFGKQLGRQRAEVRPLDTHAPLHTAPSHALTHHPYTPFHPRVPLSSPHGLTTSTQVLFRRHAGSDEQIDAAELGGLCAELGQVLSREQIELAMAKLDLDGDGTVSLDELTTYYCVLLTTTYYCLLTAYYLLFTTFRWASTSSWCGGTRVSRWRRCSIPSSTRGWDRWAPARRMP